MRISDWSSDVCSSDLARRIGRFGGDVHLDARHLERAGTVVGKRDGTRIPILLRDDGPAGARQPRGGDKCVSAGITGPGHGHRPCPSKIIPGGGTAFPGNISAGRSSLWEEAAESAYRRTTPTTQKNPT